MTAGASTPTPITKEVIDFLEAYNKNDPGSLLSLGYKRLILQVIKFYLNVNSLKSRIKPGFSLNESLESFYQE